MSDIDASHSRYRRPSRAYLNWLRPPQGPASLFVATVVTLFAALAGSAAIERLTTNDLSAAPTEEQAMAVAEVAMEQSPRNIPGPTVLCRPIWCPDNWDPDGDQVVVFDDPPDHNGGVDHATVVYWTPENELSTVVSQVRSRLVADGWTIMEVSGDDFVVADKDDLSVYVAVLDNNDPTFEGRLPTVELELDPKIPALQVGTAATVGFLGGLLLGWMMIVWFLRNYRRHEIGVKAVIHLLGLPFLVIVTLVDISVLRMFALGGMPSSLFVAPAAVLGIIGSFLIGTSTILTTVTIAIAVAAMASIVLAALPIGVNQDQGRSFGYWARRATWRR